MKRPLPLLSWLVVLFATLALIPEPARGQERGYPTTPSTREGARWRIGYYEGGPYVNYPGNLREIARGLMELGWIEDCRIPEFDNPTDAHSMWTWLVGNGSSRYVQFVGNAYWSANWDGTIREKNRREALGLLKDRCVDLIIGMGTWAGQDLACREHSVPTMVVSTSDPVKSGIIRSAEDSGFDHVHAKCDPTRYIHQVRMFHNMIGFKRLGIVFENTLEGRTYAALEDVEQVARERGFKIITCEAPFSGVDAETAAKGVARCHGRLAPKVDAVYITVHRGILPRFMPEIMAPLFEKGIPTFSMRGPVEVRHGVLFSISRCDFKAVGRYHAEVIARIFNGARPRDLDQIFKDPKKIAVNLKTAERIRYIVPPAFMKVADEIYKVIEVAEKDQGTSLPQ
ncbi:MAG: hypothetical protein JW821_05800 [Deltaproteobacteria bacterium]|nr:hypothetical protein [Deltaproteobacteria bacterium]